VADGPLFKAAYSYGAPIRTRPLFSSENGVRFGFAINGRNASQDGAAILVSDIERAKQELEANGVRVGELSVAVERNAPLGRRATSRARHRPDCHRR
jgi:hypothetical protein